MARVAPGVASPRAPPGEAVAPAPVASAPPPLVAALVPRLLRRRPRGPPPSATAGRRARAAAPQEAASGIPALVRLLVATAATVALLHNLWVHFGPLRAPHRWASPASAGWGRESAFYTFHGNCAAFFYAAASALVAGREVWLGRRGGRPAGGKVGRWVGGWPLLEGAVYGWGGVPVTAVTLVVGLGYYGLIHFHPMYVVQSCSPWKDGCAGPCWWPSHPRAWCEAFFPCLAGNASVHL